MPRPPASFWLASCRRRRGSDPWQSASWRAGVLADGWVVEMPVSPLPKTSTSLVESASGAVLELPLGWLYDDLEAMYRSIGHGRAVLNGYSGHTPARITRPSGWGSRPATAAC